ncbi:MAG: DUF342 domain-containing protein [Lachnospiraceae bacterium]|nr:DUF342 domain-containing protein [Lachnospiraceae bacterium]
MALTNGYFSLSHKQDGVYLVLIPPVDGGAPIDATEVDRYLSDNRIECEKAVIYDAVRNSSARREILVSRNPIYPVNESLSVVIDSEHTVAVARFYPPSDKGQLMGYQDIISELSRNGVRYGALEENIKAFMADRKYCTNIDVAKSLPPEDGVDAEITYHFNTNPNVKPKQNEDGSVDFHSLDNINSVAEGALIATLKPANYGRPGIDVMGKPIKQRKANPKTLREVKNTKLSEDGLNLYSTKNGHVSLVDGVIFVSDNYTVPANVDASTGDIKYNGSVTVTGNVNTGYKVEADGDVIVNGIVEGAEIIAGGQIILKRGIQGMQKGILRAGTNVVSRFIESAEVYAGGYVSTDSIMHSKIEAGMEVSVHGKKGFITGGSVKAGSYISAQITGSVMGTTTLLEVGAPQLQNEMKELEKKQSDLLENIDKIDKVVSFIGKKIADGEKLPADKQMQFITLKKQKEEMEATLDQVMERLDVVSEKIDAAGSGYILVDDVMYPGCKVTISNITTFIRTDTKHCRLVRDGADIRVKAY